MGRSNSNHGVDDRDERWSAVRAELGALGPRPVPEAVRLRLKAIAAAEHARRHRPSVWALLRTRMLLGVDHAMRRVAIPFAGGVSAAAMLIGSLTPTLMSKRASGNDVATPIYEEAYVSQVPGRMSPEAPVEEAMLVEVSINPQGRVYDVTVPEGKLSSELANEILFTTYVPAKVFGQPTQGKVILRRSRITVKG
jgi:hypothetical protein